MVECLSRINFSLRYRVIASFAPWVASKDSLNRQVEAFDGSIFFEGFYRVGRAGRCIFAKRVGAQRHTSIKFYERYKQIFHRHTLSVFQLYNNSESFARVFGKTYELLSNYWID